MTEPRPSKTAAASNKDKNKAMVALPQVRVTRRGAQRVQAGHVWIYRSDIQSTGDAPAAALVSVVDERSHVLGSALYSSASQIALRMVTRATPDGVPWTDLLRQRIAQAVDFRRRHVSNTDAYRVVFSEADSVPGLIVDRYNDLLSFQVLTQAMDPEPVRQAMIHELAERLDPVSILERVEPRIRTLEELPERSDGVAYTRAGAEPKTATIFTMNGVRFHYDAEAGQKTGAFLDQRENYAAAARYAHGRALDVFTYQGGFALHLNPVCEQVAAVDASRPALEVADRNAALNGGREIEWVEANAFDLLRDYSDAGERYDTIVLDPPAFAKTKRVLEGAVRGYKELNLRALKMLKPGGILVTCSCSFHVSEGEFLEMLSSASADAHRRVRILEKRTQSIDHPILLGVPETYYLKCVICEVG